MAKATSADLANGMTLEDIVDLKSAEYGTVDILMPIAKHWAS